MANETTISSGATLSSGDAAVDATVSSGATMSSGDAAVDSTVSSGAVATDSATGSSGGDVSVASSGVAEPASGPISIVPNGGTANASAASFGTEIYDEPRTTLGVTMQSTVLPKTGPDSTVEERVEHGVQTWWDTHIANSVTAQYVGAINHLMSVMKHLKAEIIVAVNSVDEEVKEDAETVEKDV